MLSFDGIETQQQNESFTNDSHQNVPHASSGHQAKLNRMPIEVAIGLNLALSMN